MEGYFLALDKGTSVVKGVLFDSHGAETASIRRDNTARRDPAGRHEEDAEQSWQTVAELIRALRVSSGVRADSIAAIAVTSHMGGLILLDSDRRPIAPNVLWDDTRAADIVAEWRESNTLDELVAEGGQAILAGLTLPLLRWFARERPHLLKRADALCTTKDYIVFRLTGSLGTDESDAGWMPSDPFRRGYSHRIWSLAGVSPWAHLFPPIRRPEQVVGTLTPEVADGLGLRPGTPVVAGIGDANASTIGIGAIEPGQAVTIIGTSLLNNLVTTTPEQEPAGIGFVIPTANGRWLRMLPNTGGGSINVQWIIDTAYRNGGDSFTSFEHEVACVAPGAAGVLFHPYISPAGVVAPFYHLGARGQFTGLHTGVGRAELARAVLEGIAYSIRDCFDPIPVQLCEVRLSGGSARSTVLCQIVADVLGTPVVLTTGEESAARGVALLAAWGTGRYATLEEATTAFVTVRRSFEPSPAAHDDYSERFELFKRIREAMVPIWTQAQALAARHSPAARADG